MILPAVLAELAGTGADLAHLAQALTHPSFANEQKRGPRVDYQRHHLPGDAGVEPGGSAARERRRWLTTARRPGDEDLADHAPAGRVARPQAEAVGVAGLDPGRRGRPAPPAAGRARRSARSASASSPCSTTGPRTATTSRCSATARTATSSWTSRTCATRSGCAARCRTTWWTTCSTSARRSSRR